MSRTLIESTPIKPYLNANESAEYVRSKGPTKTTGNSIKAAAYRSRKLGRPKIISGVAYWTREQLDAWLDAL